MGINRRKSVWLIGPLGYGHLIEVNGMPEEDAGKRVESYLLTFGCDAAMAARALGLEWQKTLIGNCISSDPYGAALREVFARAGVELIEITGPPKSPSCDIIVVNSQNDTRTVFSNITPPSTHEFNTSIKELARTRALPAWIYVDDFPGVRGTALRDLTRLGPKLLYNLGDITSVDSVPSIDASGGLIFLQISLKNFGGSRDENLAVLLDRSTDDLAGAAICVTSGSGPVTIIGRGQMVSVPVVPVRGANTAGAGAVFSRFLLERIEDSGVQVNAEPLELVPTIEHACRSTANYLTFVLTGKAPITCQLDTDLRIHVHPSLKT